MADAVPATAIEKWQAELKHEKDEYRKAEVARRIEAFSDQGYGCAVFRNPLVADRVQDVLFSNHGGCCRLGAWVVMPNHVHVIVTPIGHSIGEVVRRLKGATSVEVNRLLERKGRLWQPGFFDRVIRSGEHFDRTQSYIEWNPVKAQLCADPALWRTSSRNPEARHKLELAVQARLKATENSLQLSPDAIDDASK